MGKISRPRCVKLIVGLIFKEEDILAKAQNLLSRKFGRIDFQSPVLEFDLTDYYEKEFGKGLKRKFISFKKPILPCDLAAVKIFTNNLETKFSEKGSRRVNIDPGYLDLAKLVLASTKDFVHRIYIGRGIFAEVTLFWKNSSFNHWEWTYPDYRTPEYISIFNAIRQDYASSLKK